MELIEKILSEENIIDNWINMIKSKKSLVIDELFV